MAFVTAVGIAASAAQADYATVINSPPDSIGDLKGIGSNTQLNLYTGAVLKDNFIVGQFSQANSHIEVNLCGGTIGQGFSVGASGLLIGNTTNTDVIVNMYDGYIGDNFRLGYGASFNMSGGLLDSSLGASLGSVINISGGTITGGSLFESPLAAGGGGVLNISGGAIRSGIAVYGGGTLNMSGGAISGPNFISFDGFIVSGVANVSGGTTGQIRTAANSQLNLSGGDFRLDGVPIDGLGSGGSSLPFNVPADSVLTGTLTDGTPLSISGENIIEFGDRIEDGTLTLHTTPIPAATPAVFNSPGTATAGGLRAGQSLTVGNGGVVRNNFNASWGSVVNVRGGQIGDGFEATGAIVNVSGGSIGQLSSAFLGSIVNLSGGSIGANFSATRGSVVNISGGGMGGLFEARTGSVVNVSGGTIDDLQTYDGSQFTISGSEFRLNGMPISGLTTMGSSRSVDVPVGGVLSGTYADGTSFVFSDQAYDYFAAGTLTLGAVAVPAATPAVFQVPSSAAPKGLRTGQSLILADGGIVGERFTAGWGSTVTISGGQVGDLFKAVGAMINVCGGAFSGRFNALYGSSINISGGSFSGAFSAGRGSVVNIAGGSLDYIFYAQSGSVINIAGGTVGTAYSYADSGSVINLSGGAITGDMSTYGATLNISGGTLAGQFFGATGSTVNISGGAFGDHFDNLGNTTISGGEFRLDGVPISGFGFSGGQRAFDIPSGSVLSGTFVDGTPFAFSDMDGDQFAKGMLQLQSWELPSPRASTLHLPGSPVPLGLRERQTLAVGPGGKIGDNFTAGWGSVVTMFGGELGSNFEAVGAQVTIAGGKVGDNFDAFYGSIVSISGGTIGSYFDAHRGSTVNLTGGNMGAVITADDGSVLNISGGLSGYPYAYQMRAAAGSEIHVSGYNFTLDGDPIANLVPGTPFSITARNVMLRGTLADGSVFSFELDPTVGGAYYFSRDALLTVTSLLYGDFNGDGAVDMADYVVWRIHLGTLYSQSDYNVWRANFGRTGRDLTNPRVYSAVPEPACLAIFVMAMLGVPTLRCSKRIHRPHASPFVGQTEVAPLFPNPLPARLAR